jgi:GAF domain-containing protein
MSDLPLSTSLAALSRFLYGDMTVAETLTRVSELSQEAVPSARCVGLTLRVDGQNRTAVFTDDLAPQVDQAQYDADDGPCLTAFREHRTTTIEDTAEAGEWPAFRASALAHGVRSTLSLPLIVDQERAVGAMNLYSGEPEAFSDDDRRVGELFAAQSAIVLANAQAFWDAQELSANLGEAMISRAVIEQAKGILMGAQGITADDAFALLVKASQRENTKLRDVAARIVANVIARGPRPGPPEGGSA